MQVQNVKNHIRLVKGYHGLTFGMMLLLFGFSILNYVHSNPATHYAAAMFLLITIIFFLLFWYIRSFALKAQDRAIRAEETLRYFILTGKRIPNSLRISQIIALRFASDEELPNLVERATNENLKSKEIKQSILNWRADYYRV